MKLQELERMHLDILDKEEMQETYGGTLPTWFRGFSWAALGSEIITHWGEIKKGLTDGWNSIK